MTSGARRELGRVVAGAVVACGTAAAYARTPSSITPPWTSLDGLAQWLRQSDTALVALALIRVFVLVAGAYLVAVLVLSVIADTSGRAAWQAVVRRATLPCLRTFVAPAAASMAGVVALGAMAPPPTIPRPHVTAADEVMPEVPGVASVGAPPTDPAPSSTSTTTATTDAPLTTASTATTTNTGDPGDVAVIVPSPEVDDPADIAVIVEVADPAATVAARRTVVVGPGDSFWALAREHLDDVDAPMDDAAVARFVERFIDANRDRLADPANPSLLFVGQELELPATTP